MPQKPVDNTPLPSAETPASDARAYSGYSQTPRDRSHQRSKPTATKKPVSAGRVADVGGDVMQCAEGMGLPVGTPVSLFSFVFDKLSDDRFMKMSQRYDEEQQQLKKDIAELQRHFVDMLADIDEYERYCEAHPGYKNNRAVIAIANVKRVYAENEKNNSFLKA